MDRPVRFPRPLGHPGGAAAMMRPPVHPLELGQLVEAQEEEKDRAFLAEFGKLQQAFGRALMPEITISPEGIQAGLRLKRARPGAQEQAPQGDGGQ